MRDFIFVPMVKSLLHILYLEFLCSSGCKGSLVADGVSQSQGAWGLPSCMQAIPHAPAAERQKGRVSLFQFLDLLTCDILQPSCSLATACISNL